MKNRRFITVSVTMLLSVWGQEVYSDRTTPHKRHIGGNLSSQQSLKQPSSTPEARQPTHQHKTDSDGQKVNAVSMGANSSKGAASAANNQSSGHKLSFGKVSVSPSNGRLSVKFSTKKFTHAFRHHTLVYNSMLASSQNQGNTPYGMPKGMYITNLPYITHPENAETYGIDAVYHINGSGYYIMPEGNAYKGLRNNGTITHSNIKYETSLQSQFKRQQKHLQIDKRPDANAAGFRHLDIKYTLHFANGNRYFLDDYGKCVAVADKYFKSGKANNYKHITLLHYQNSEKGPINNPLKSITNGTGYHLKFVSRNDTIQKIIYPPNGSGKQPAVYLQSDQGNITSISHDLLDKPHKTYQQGLSFQHNARNLVSRVDRMLFQNHQPVRKYTSYQMNYATAYNQVPRVSKLVTTYYDPAREKTDQLAPGADNAEIGHQIKRYQYYKKLKGNQFRYGEDQAMKNLSPYNSRKIGSYTIVEMGKLLHVHYYNKLSQPVRLEVYKKAPNKEGYIPVKVHLKEYDSVTIHNNEPYLTTHYKKPVNLYKMHCQPTDHQDHDYRAVAISRHSKQYNDHGKLINKATYPYVSLDSITNARKVNYCHGWPISEPDKDVKYPQLDQSIDPKSRLVTKLDNRYQVVTSKKQYDCSLSNNKTDCSKAHILVQKKTLQDGGRQVATKKIYFKDLAADTPQRTASKLFKYRYASDTSPCQRGGNYYHAGLKCYQKLMTADANTASNADRINQQRNRYTIKTFKYDKKPLADSKHGFKILKTVYLQHHDNSAVLEDGSMVSSVSQQIENYTQYEQINGNTVRKTNHFTTRVAQPNQNAQASGTKEKVTLSRHHNFNVGGLKTSMVDYKGRKHQYLYDYKKLSVTKKIFPESDVREHEHRNNNAGLTVHRKKYDPLFNVIKLEKTTNSGLQLHSRRHYDYSYAKPRLKKVTDQHGNVTLKRYSPTGRVTSIKKCRPYDAANQSAMVKNSVHCSQLENRSGSLATGNNTAYLQTKYITRDYGVDCQDEYGCYIKLDITNHKKALHQTLYVIKVKKQSRHSKKHKPLFVFKQTSRDGKILETVRNNYDRTGYNLLDHYRYNGTIDKDNLILHKHSTYTIFGSEKKSTVYRTGNNIPGQSSSTGNEAVTTQVKYYDPWHYKVVQKVLYQGKHRGEQQPVFKTRRKIYNTLGKVVYRCSTLPATDSSASLPSTRQDMPDIVSSLCTQQQDGRVYYASTRYDNLKRPVDETDMKGNHVLNVYNGHHQMIRRVITGTGDQAGNNGNHIVEHYNYDPYGEVIRHGKTEKGNHGNVHYKRDPKTRKVTDIKLGGFYKATGRSDSVNSQHLSYREQYNQLASYHSPGDITYQFSYQPNGKLDHIEMSSLNKAVLNGKSNHMRQRYYPYAYNKRKPGEQGYYPGKLKSRTWEINHEGNRRQQKIHYKYDAHGNKVQKRIQTRVNGQSYVTTADFTYDYRGGKAFLVSKTYHTNHPGAQQQSRLMNKRVCYTYNALNQLAQERTIYNPSAGDKGCSQPARIVRYHYNVNNDITRVSSVLPGSGASDDKHKRIETYKYNARGQLLSRKVHNKTGNKSSSTSHYTYQYNANGNMTAEWKQTGQSQDQSDQQGKLQARYTFNIRNKLSGYKSYENGQPASHYQYQYYPGGHRWQKSYRGQDNSIREKINFYLNFKGKLSREVYTDYHSNKGTLQRLSSYIGPFRLLHTPGEGTYQTQTSTSFRHNRPEVISVDKSGNVVLDSLDISAYGQVAESSDSEKTGTPDSDPKASGFQFKKNPLVYRTSYFDRESGLYHMNARYYDPEIRRFIAEDRKNLLNRYGYARGNPVSNIDPSGHFSWSLFTEGMTAIAELFMGSALMIASGGVIGEGWIINSIKIAGTGLLASGILEGVHAANAAISGKNPSMEQAGTQIGYDLLGGMVGSIATEGLGAGLDFLSEGEYIGKFAYRFLRVLDVGLTAPLYSTDLYKGQMTGKEAGKTIAGGLTIGASMELLAGGTLKEYLDPGGGTSEEASGEVSSSAEQASDTASPDTNTEQQNYDPDSSSSNTGSERKKSRVSWSTDRMKAQANRIFKKDSLNMMIWYPVSSAIQTDTSTYLHGTTREATKAGLEGFAGLFASVGIVAM